jgi:L-2-hydroxyglutarate oxidase LhgO
MERFEAQTVIIGAGVAGLACAAALAARGYDVIVLEAASAFGTETSARNSEVIHAGLYYRTGSLKAELCVRGRRMLYQHLETFRIPYWKCGKLVVAIGDEERDSLTALLEQARVNDVEEITLLSRRQALDLEPHLSPETTGAILSGTSGIFDSHAYMLSLVGLIEDRGGQLAFNTRVTGGEVTPDGIRLVCAMDGAATLLEAQYVINAAGHGALPLARSIEGPHQAALAQNRFVKGSYFTVSGKTPFQRLIYPMHSAASLGLHLTIDLQGQGRLGPDAEWLPEKTAEPPFDYQVDPGRADHFLETVRRYWPGLERSSLNPGYAGVRPKLVGPGEPSGDFRIEAGHHHGSKGLVNLLGIESPGLTSSMAIGAHVADLITSEA